MVGLPPMLMLCECKREQETENRPINKQTEGGKGQKHRGGECNEIKDMKRTAVEYIAQSMSTFFSVSIQYSYGVHFHSTLTLELTHDGTKPLVPPSCSTSFILHICK